MGIFSSTQSYLGVDLGAVSTKVVELRNEKGRPRLVTYGFVEEAVDLARNDSPEAKEKITAFLKEVCAQAGVKTNKAIAALPTFSVFSSIVSLPKVAKKDLPSTIRWEAKKVIPMPLEEMILDWKILPDEEPVSSQPKSGSGIEPEIERVIKTKEGSQYMKILLTGAPKELVRKFMEVFKGAGLQLISLETESFALVRSLVGEDKSTVMIIDLGGVTTNLSVIDKGVPVLNRSLEIGGSTITRAIADGLSINLARAEQFKRDMGISLGSGQNEVPKTIEASVAPIINEIKYCFGLYQNQALSAPTGQFPKNGINGQLAGSGSAIFNGRIEKIVLTGGSALLPNLAEYLSKLLDIKVYLGDPWSRIIYPIELRPILEEIGSRFSVALGLAMRDID